MLIPSLVSIELLTEIESAILFFGILLMIVDFLFT